MASACRRPRSKALQKVRQFCGSCYSLKEGGSPLSFWEPIACRLMLSACRLTVLSASYNHRASLICSEFCMGHVMSHKTMVLLKCCSTLFAVGLTYSTIPVWDMAMSQKSFERLQKGGGVWQPWCAECKPPPLCRPWCASLLTPCGSHGVAQLNFGFECFSLGMDSRRR